MKETIPGTAIVLAAGLGSRLAKISPGLPKALISVGGQPIINYALNAIAITSIETVAVVVSSPHNNVQQHVYSKYKNAFALRFPVQQPANGPGDALLCALVSEMGKKELEDGTLVLGCDYKLPVNYVDELMAFHGSHKSPPPLLA